jgi:hypothetical protein
VVRQKLSFSPQNELSTLKHVSGIELCAYADADAGRGPEKSLATNPIEQTNAAVELTNTHRNLATDSSMLQRI